MTSQIISKITMRLDDDTEKIITFSDGNVPNLTPELIADMPRAVQYTLHYRVYADAFWQFTSECTFIRNDFGDWEQC